MLCQMKDDQALYVTTMSLKELSANIIRFEIVVVYMTANNKNNDKIFKLEFNARYFAHINR